MADHFSPHVNFDPEKTCFTCYFFNGEMSGPHPVCHEEYPEKQVRGLPAVACAHYRAHPRPGEPKPLIRSERLKKSGQ